MSGADGNERLVYCHCAYAKVVPPKVKGQVLHDLGATDRDFEAVPDLCEMSARKDPLLAEFAEDKGLRIVACYPRAVRWLFHAAGTPLGDDVEVLNMRALSAADIATKLAGPPAPAAVEETNTSANDPQETTP